MNENEELEKKILKYFNPKELVILDDGYNSRGHYNSVTVTYIYKYVLNKEYEMSDIIDKLLEMHTDEKIYALFCGTVENVVFHNRVINYWNYQLNNGYERYSNKYAYDYFINYLKQLKIENQLEIV
jgi:stress-induced morphogen